MKKWKNEINSFLKNKLELELHSDKSKIISLSKPISFVGFRIFYYNKLLKKFNQRNIQRKLKNFHRLFLEDKISYDEIYESIQGSFAYAKHANTYKLRDKLTKQMEEYFPNEVFEIEINQHLRALDEMNK